MLKLISVIQGISVFKMSNPYQCKDLVQCTYTQLEQELLEEGGIMGAGPHFVAIPWFYRYGAIKVQCKRFLLESVVVKNIANKIHIFIGYKNI